MQVNTMGRGLIFLDTSRYVGIQVQVNTWFGETVTSRMQTQTQVNTWFGEFTVGVSTKLRQIPPMQCQSHNYAIQGLRVC